MNWLYRLFIVFFSLFFLSETWAFELTEKSVLLLSIQKKNSLKLLSLNRGLDSLNLQKIYNERIPQITASIEPAVNGYQPNERISSRLDNTTLTFVDDTIELSPKSSVTTKLQITQKVPGGGEVAVSADGTISNTGTTKTYAHSSNYSLFYYQPLLKNAWRWGELNHSYRIATMHDEELSFQSKKNLLSDLTSIRRQYWTLYEKKAMLTIYVNELQRAEELLSIEKVRVKLGESTMLDSLSAALNVLTAQQSVMDANIEYETSLNELAAEFGISPDTLWLEDSSEIIIPDLPDDTTLILNIEHFDPSLRVFQKITERLCLDHERILHKLYPDLLLKTGVNHNRSGERFLSEKGESGTNGVIALVMSYSLPVRQNFIEQAQSRYEFQKNEISEKQYRNEVSSKLGKLKLSWKKELNRLNLSQQIVTLSGRQYDVAQKQYELGLITRLVLFDAKNKLVKSESDFLRSRLQMKQLEIILDELSGTLFEKFNMHLK